MMSEAVPYLRPQRQKSAYRIAGQPEAISGGHGPPGWAEIIRPALDGGGGGIQSDDAMRQQAAFRGCFVLVAMLMSVAAANCSQETPARGRQAHVPTRSSVPDAQAATRAAAPALPDGIEVISGRVHDGRGKAVSAARILCWAVDGEHAVPIKEVRSDGRGGFSLPGLHRGRHKLLIEAPGFDTASFTALAPARDLRLPLGGESGSLTGVVVGGEGKPVAGARVLLLGGEEREPRETVSDEEGEFNFGEVEPGRYRLHAVAGRSSTAPGELVTVGDVEEPAPVQVRLLPAVWLSGVVNDGSGRPLAGAEVLVDAEPETGIPEIVRADAQGRWNAGAVALGRYRLQARAPGHLMPPEVVSVDGAHSRSHEEKLVMKRPTAHRSQHDKLQAKSRGRTMR